MSGKRKKPLYKRFFSRRVKSHGSHKALAAMTAILGLIMMSFGFVSAPALATGGAGSDDNFKVFVCKYVGTPGDDERLQTGQNPISVSVNSIPDYQGVGSYFADQHGRSFVLAVDDTPPGPAGDPDVSACPPPDNPPDVIQIPATPSSEDPCGPNNATWNVPADTDTLNWELLPNGHLTVTIVAEDTTFPGGATSHDFGKAPESGKQCPVEPEGDITVTIDCESITINPPTGVKPEGAVIKILLDGKDARPETWTVEPGEHTVELYVNGELVDSVTVTVKKCEEPGDTVPVPNQETVDPCNPPGVTNNVDWKHPLPDDTDKVDWSESNNGATRTATLKDSDDKWSDGTKEPKVFNLPADSGEKCETPPELVVTVIPNQGSCEARTPKAQVTTSFASSIAYQVTGQERVFVHQEVQAGTYTVTLPDVAEGSSVNYDIVVVPLDDSAEAIVKGPFTFSVPANCDEVPPCIEFQDENPNAPCYVEREPDVREKSSERESCKLGGVVTTHAVFTTTYSFNEVTQQWESSETATSSQSFDPYTAAELKEKGCVKAPPPDDDNPPSDHPTNPPHAGATSGSSSLSSNLMVGAGGTFLMAALIMLFGARRRQVGEV